MSMGYWVFYYVFMTSRYNTQLLFNNKTKIKYITSWLARLELCFLVSILQQTKYQIL